MPSMEAEAAYVPQQQGEGVTEQPTGVGSSLGLLIALQGKHGAGGLFFICISLNEEYG